MLDQPNNGANTLGAEVVVPEVKGHKRAIVAGLFDVF
jgi:hypothetical protein